MKISAGFLKTKDYKTFYKIYGEINNNTIPLIILCGGPGSPFYSYEGPFKELGESGLTIVFYNQHGCGFSTINNDKYKELYTFESFEEELELLAKHLNIKKYHLLGHSWGGMLALHYVTNKYPKNISSLILFSTLPSTKIWNQENSRSIKNYPISYKKALLNEFEGKKYNEKIFTNASNRFVSEHVNDHKNDFKEFYPYKNPYPFGRELYNYMWGKSEVYGNGTLLNYDVTDKLKNIKIKTLIISGQEDESSPYINKLMHDNIKNSKWELLEYSQHIGYVQENKKVISILKEWLNLN